ncbi:hypothetical protein SAMN05428944_0013 [Streptomyces sp. 1222.5]|nr:hypothetical protein BX260_0010 [Streptomyces sp. 5112.2]SEB52386.1 hypothetical protein SAMN05428944_0013 [Streptomyces sp. 1222.5]
MCGLALGGTPAAGRCSRDPHSPGAQIPTVWPWKRPRSRPRAGRRPGRLADDLHHHHHRSHRRSRPRPPPHGPLALTEDHYEAWLDPTTPTNCAHSSSSPPAATSTPARSPRPSTTSATTDPTSSTRSACSCGTAHMRRTPIGTTVCPATRLRSWACSRFRVPRSDDGGALGIDRVDRPLVEEALEPLQPEDPRLDRLRRPVQPHALLLPRPVAAAHRRPVGRRRGRAASQPRPRPTCAQATGAPLRPVPAGQRLDSCPRGAVSIPPVPRSRRSRRDSHARLGVEWQPRLHGLSAALPAQRRQHSGTAVHRVAHRRGASEAAEADHHDKRHEILVGATGLTADPPKAVPPWPLHVRPPASSDRPGAAAAGVPLRRAERSHRQWIIPFHSPGTVRV